MSVFLRSLRDRALVLTEKQLRFLEKHGDWLLQIDNGALPPATRRQERFLSVCRGESQPIHPEEILWVAVKAVMKRDEELASQLAKRELINDELRTLRIRASVLQEKLQATETDLAKHKEWLKSSHEEIARLERAAKSDADEPTDPLSVYDSPTGNDWREQQ